MPARCTFHERIDRTGRYSTLTHMRCFLKQGEFLLLGQAGRQRLVQLS